MTRPSSVNSLPPEILAAVNRLLAEEAATLDEIVAKLDEMGHPRSRSALGRHSLRIKRAGRRLRQSREITEALAREVGDAATQGRQGRVMVELTRTLVFDMIERLAEIDEAAGPVDEDGNPRAPVLSPRDAAFLGKGLAELSRALRLDQDFEEKVREQVREEERVKAAAAAETIVRERGLSDEDAAIIRAKILGVKVDGAG